MSEQELIGGSIKFLFCVSSEPQTSNSNNSTSNVHDLNLTQQHLFHLQPIIHLQEMI